jgi:hypothetical protein
MPKKFLERKAILREATLTNGCLDHNEADKPIESNLSSAHEAGRHGRFDVVADAPIGEGIARWQWQVRHALAKCNNSVYPMQQRSPEQEFPFWMKHRWAF